MLGRSGTNKVYTYSKIDNVGVVWFDRGEIVGNDGHLVVIDAENLGCLSTRIDQPETVLLALLKLEFGETGIVSARGAGTVGGRTVEVHLSIDHVVVGQRRRQ